MNRKDFLIVLIAFGILSFSISLALAQSGKSEKQGATPSEKKNPYSEANLKFDILETQIQTLRKKMQLQSKKKAEQTKEWDQHYQKVKQHIEAWDDFVDSYDLELTKHQSSANQALLSLPGFFVTSPHNSFYLARPSCVMFSRECRRPNTVFGASL